MRKRCHDRFWPLGWTAISRDGKRWCGHSHIRYHTALKCGRPHGFVVEKVVGLNGHLPIIGTSGLKALFPTGEPAPTIDENAKSTGKPWIGKDQAIGFPTMAESAAKRWATRRARQRGRCLTCRPPGPEELGR